MLYSWRYACYSPQHDKEKECRSRDPRRSRGKGAKAEAEQERTKRTGPEGCAYPVGEGQQAGTKIGAVAPRKAEQSPTGRVDAEVPDLA